MIEVATVLIVKDGKLYMTKRKSNEDCYAGKWTFPAGHVEAGEQPYVALKREMKEELGIEIKGALQCSTISDMDPTSGQAFKHHMFIVKNWKGDLKGCKEAEQAAWFSKNEIKGIDTFPVTYLMLRCLKS